jgi:hypothetical protein
MGFFFTVFFTLAGYDHGSLLLFATIWLKLMVEVMA